MPTIARAGWRLLQLQLPRSPGFFQVPNLAATFERRPPPGSASTSVAKALPVERRGPFLTTAHAILALVPIAKPESISNWAERAQRLELQLARKSPSFLDVFEPRSNLKTADAPSASERFVIANLRRSVKKS
jgi:hypothetical protein